MKIIKIIISIFLILLIGCNINKEPQVEISILLTGDTNIKELSAEVVVKNTSKILNEKIEMPDLFYYIDTYDVPRSKRGGGFTRNNEGEPYIRSEKHIIFDSTGLKDDEIRNIFKNANITVIWQAMNGEEIIQTYSIGELMEIKNTKIEE